MLKVYFLGFSKIYTVTHPVTYQLKFPPRERKFCAKCPTRVCHANLDIRHHGYMYPGYQSQKIIKRKNKEGYKFPLTNFLSFKF